MFFIVIRLFGITNAPLEVGHNWRQSLTSMIARNFYEYGANLFYPVIDLAGEKTGIIGSEFPFFNYLIYLVSEVFGYSHWHGRLINLLITSVGIFYFYKLIKETVGLRVAFFSAFLLSTSVWFGFGRKIMPDTFSVALVIIGIYFGYMYLKEARFKNLLLFFILSTLGILCKIPALSLFSVFGIAFFIKSIPVSRKVTLYLVGALSFSIVCVWYFYWVPYLVTTYGYELYFPRSMSEGFKEVLELWPQLLEKFYFVAFSSFIGFACFLGGVYFMFKDRSLLKWVIVSISVITVVFITFIIKTGLVFPLHSYYVVPYVPVMALVAGYFLSKVKPRYAYIILTLVTIEAIANQQDDMFIKKSEEYKLGLESITEKYVPSGSLIVINGTPSPQHMYFSHCKGWTETSEVIKQDNFLDSVSSLGAEYLIWDKIKGELPKVSADTIYEDADYFILNISK
ncbi:MAG: hypothetical protein COA58_14920 [Bacteroidetes bacterium]|nr:MAG: hypothetical protein COA58_14920 [Bacteroidota bacterium]